MYAYLINILEIVLASVIMTGFKALFCGVKESRSSSDKIYYRVVAMCSILTLICIEVVFIVKC